MMKLELASSEELHASEFWIARFGALRRSNLILYVTVLWLRQTFVLTTPFTIQAFNLITL